MRFEIRQPRLSGLHPRGAFRARVELLESRDLLAASINFGGQPPQIATTTPGPYGVLLAGGTHVNSGGDSGGAGTSVAQVGNLLGTNFEDYVVGSPGVITDIQAIDPLASMNFNPSPEVYLVQGDQRWVGLADNQRVADLTQLGQTTQTSPIAIPGTAAQFPYQGLTFDTPSEGASGLGWSVAPVETTFGNISTTVGFLVGAPNQNGGTGAVYLVYVSGLPQPSPTTPIDLDGQTGTIPSNISIVKITNSSSGAAGSQLGASVATIGNFLGDGTDIAVGAPNASVNGATGGVNTGAVYVFPLTDVPAVPGKVTNFDLNTINPLSGGVAGMVFAGPKPGSGFGFSVAGAGITESNVGADDMLVGAPFNSDNFGNADNGTAYLIHGGQTFNSLASVSNPTNLSGLFIDANNIGGPFDPLSSPSASATQRVLGGTFTGGPFDETGFSVGTAGDFNDDGNADIQFGSPFFTPTQGTTTILSPVGVDSVVYSLPGYPITGQFFMPDETVLNANPLVPPVQNPPSNYPSGIGVGYQTTGYPNPTDPNDGGTVLAANFVGSNAGDLTGYSVSTVSPMIPQDINNELLVGAPGNNNSSGEAYIIPGTPNTLTTNLVGNFSLQEAVSSPSQVNATRISLSRGSTFDTTGRPTFFGFSVSGSGALNGDFVVGAPGYAASTTRIQDGGAFVGLNQIVNSTGVFPLQQARLDPATLQGGAGTNVINTGAAITNLARTNNLITAVTIRVFSDTRSVTQFTPVTELQAVLSKPIVLNGYEIPSGAWKVADSGGDFNGDGVHEADVTITFANLVVPRNPPVPFNVVTAILGNNPSLNETVLIGGPLLTVQDSSVTTPEFWLGSNAVGGVFGGVSSGATGAILKSNIFNATSPLLPFGPDVFVPSVAALSAYDYKAIPRALAYRQFLPPAQFRQRIINYYDPAHAKNTRVVEDLVGVRDPKKTPLPSGSSTKGRAATGKVVKFTHKVPVVPTNRQRERYIL